MTISQQPEQPPPTPLPPPQQVYVLNPGNNGLATASFILGLLWLCGLGSILAIIFGHIAINQIRNSGQSGRGLAVAGLVLGYAPFGFLVMLWTIGAISNSVSLGT